MYSHTINKIFLWIIAIMVTVMTPVGMAGADTAINISVKTVLASQSSQFHDPQLADLIEELQSVFRYTSYRLLTHDRISLRIGKTGTINLPGRRILEITPQGISDNRAELQLTIAKEKQLVFKTTIKLLNRSSITVGGPRDKEGYLLINISNFF